MEQIKVSVVMATYNGEKYLTEQLDSILKQTRAADEILIFDDASTDRTKEILLDYEKKYANIKVNINNHNIGWRENFAQGINRASGNIIFLADQDDIWFKDKIEKMTREMMENDTIELMASSFVPLYESEGANKIPSYQYKNLGKKHLAQVKEPRWYCECLRPGCCYCFRKKLIPYFNQIWNKDNAHDSILWKIAAFRGSLYIMNEELMCFRRHTQNNSPVSYHDVEKRVRRFDELLKVMNTIESTKEIGLDYSNITILNKCQNYFRARANVIQKKSIQNIIEAIKYINYYPRLFAFLGDIISSMNSF